MDTDDAAAATAGGGPWQTFLERLRAAGAGCPATAALPLRAADPPPGALAAYFGDVPAHAAALAQLDHTQFVNAVPCGPTGDFPLRAALEALAGAGPVAYARAWLAVLDLAAAACGGEGPDRAAARAFVERTLATGGGEAPPPPPSPLGSLLAGMGAAAPGGGGQMDAAVGMLMGSVPGLQETLTQLLAPPPEGSDAGGPGGASSFLGTMVDRVQHLFAAGPGGAPLDLPPHLQPAVTQILEGFRALSQALAREEGGPN